MENVFEGAEEMVAKAESPEILAPENTAAKKKAERAEKMKTLMAKTIQEDPTIVDKIGSMSDSLEVINTLCWSDKGGLVVDKAKAETVETTDPNSKKPRPLLTVAAIVGYVVRNCGTTDIPYETEVYAANEKGIYEGTRVERVLKPGEQVCLTRQYITMLCARPEFSFLLRNGKITAGSGTTGPGKTAKEILEGHYFSFSKNPDGTHPQVNDDMYKRNVGETYVDEAGQTQWKVKEEFLETFGYLNNPSEKTKSSAPRTRGTKSKIPTQAYMANMVYRMMQEGGNL